MNLTAASIDAKQVAAMRAFGRSLFTEASRNPGTPGIDLARKLGLIEPAGTTFACNKGNTGAIGRGGFIIVAAEPAAEAEKRGPFTKHRLTTALRDAIALVHGVVVG